MRVRAFPSWLRTLAVAACALALMAVDLISAPAPPAEAAPKPAAAPTITPARPTPGQKLTVTGKLATKTKRPVRLERQQSSRWLLVATAKSTAAGSYRFSTLAPRVGRHRYRVVASAGRFRLRGTVRKLPTLKSKTRELVVAKPPTVPTPPTPAGTLPPTPTTPSPPPSAPVTPTATSSSSTPTPSADPPPGLCATALCDPLSLPRDTVASYSDVTGSYWIYQPSEATPDPRAWTLLIWLHGCGGDHGDLWGAADYWGDHYLALAPDGAEGGCWNLDTGPDRVLAAIASARAHFPVDLDRVVLGGYSSGGDLAYKTAFRHAEQFAGVLAMNTAPFQDNGMSAEIASQAAWRFPIVHVAHDADTTYPLASVNTELDALAGLGFPVQRQVLPGGHWEAASETNPGTWHDFQNVLIKEHLDDDWTR